jgi:hypothetical protein
VQSVIHPVNLYDIFLKCIWILKLLHDEADLPSPILTVSLQRVWRNGRVRLIWNRHAWVRATVGYRTLRDTFKWSKAKRRSGPARSLVGCAHVETCQGSTHHPSNQLGLCTSKGVWL